MISRLWQIHSSFKSRKLAITENHCSNLECQNSRSRATLPKGPAQIQYTRHNRTQNLHSKRHPIHITLSIRDWLLSKIKQKLMSKDEMGISSVSFWLYQLTSDTFIESLDEQIIHGEAMENLKGLTFWSSLNSETAAAGLIIVTPPRQAVRQFLSCARTSSLRVDNSDKNLDRALGSLLRFVILC